MSKKKDKHSVPSYCQSGTRCRHGCSHTSPDHSVTIMTFNFMQFLGTDIELLAIGIHPYSRRKFKPNIVAAVYINELKLKQHATFMTKSRQ